MENKRCVILARVSKDEQARTGHSLKDQEERLKEYAKKNGLILIKTFIADGEIATDHTKRPIFNEMLDFVVAEQIPYVLVTDGDRLSRNKADDMVIDDLAEEGHTFIEVCEGGVIGKDVEDDFREIKRACRIVEIKKLKSRIKRAIYRLREEGGFPGWARCGYLNKDKEVVIDPERAKYVKMAYELYSDGTWGYKDLLKKLSDEGLRNRKGGKYGLKTMYDILSSKFYLGMIQGNPENGIRPWVRGKHEPLISEELFNKVQEIRRKKSNNSYQKTDYYFMYKGQAKCDCGCSLTPYKSRAGGTVYYKCSHSKTDKECKQKSLRSEVLDGYYEEAMSRLFLDKEWESWIIDQIGSFNIQNEASLKKERAKLKTKLSLIKKSLVRVYRDAVEQNVRQDIYLQTQKEFEMEESVIKGKLKYLEKFNPNWKKDALEFVKWMKDIKKVYLRADERVRREILDVLANRMVVNNGNYVMEWRMPFGIWAELKESGGNEYQVMALKI